MPKITAYKSFSELAMDEILAAAAGKRYTDSEVCKRAHISAGTFSRRKKNPESLTLGEIERLRRVLDLKAEIRREAVV